METRFDMRAVFVLFFFMLIQVNANAQIATQRRTVDNFFDEGFWIQAADLDLDGDADIVAASRFDGIKWFKNDGTGVFTEHGISSSFTDTWQFHVADLDNDGDPDIVACGETTNKTSWFENNGSEVFTEHVLDTQSLKPHSVFAADISGDGYRDILIAAWEGGEVVWWENSPNQSFTRHVLDNSFGSPHAVAAADLDGDGDEDVVAVGGATTHWWRNDGNNSFTKLLISSSGGFGIFARDFDEDGKIDLFRTERNNHDLDWFKNHGGGTFSKQLIKANHGESWSVDIGDFDLDGDNDVVSSAYVPNSISIFVNNGFASYAEQVQESNIVRPRSVAVADYDQDGDEDVALVITRDDVIVWYEILGSPPDNATITLTQPSVGDTLFSGEPFTIKWQSTGYLNSVKIEYSADGGSTWNVIVNSVPNSGQFSWTVPAGATANGLIRVSDAGDGFPSDVSDVPFSVAVASITVVSPNGGETWFGGSQQPLTWVSVGFAGMVKLEYSADGGASWAVLADSTANDGAFLWTVPESATTTGKIRVAAAADGSPSDISDGDFTIVASTLQLTAPNGGEFLTANSVSQVTWSSTGVVNGVKIAYSIDGGLTWTEVIASTPDDGTFDWTVPDIEASDVRLRIEDAVDGVPSDVSDGAFAISNTVLTITAPNGGESWQAGSAQLITWTSAGDLPTVKIEYSLDAGTSWFTVVALTSNSGSSVWTLPNESTTQALIRISDSGDGIPFDVSDSLFTITAAATNASLTVLSPNGGETLTAGAAHTITWSSTGNVPSVKLEFSADDGASWSLITANAANTGSYTWSVPQTNTIQARIRISDTADGDPVDVSDSPFAITTGSTNASLTILSPNGGETLTAGAAHTITWSSTGNVPSVKLEFSADDGASWALIAASAANTGSYTWSVPQNNTTQARIRISDAADGDPVDVSNASFSVAPPAAEKSITVISPNGGETWVVGSSRHITWSTSGAIDSVTLHYSIDAGTTWQVIAAATPNTGSQSWTIPATVTTQALVRVSDSDDALVSDQSDGLFAIAGSGGAALTLVSPNGGELWTGGSPKNISWTSTGVVSSVSLDYTVDNGSHWVNIVGTTPNDGSYLWLLPDIQSNSVRVRVADVTGTATPDESDLPFTIIGTSFTVLSPNGGEFWAGGDVQTIRWASTGVVAEVKLEYSLDAGSSWTDIISRTPNDGSFDWLLPTSESSQACVRVSDADDSQPADVSDGLFTIGAATGVGSHASLPERFHLSQNYPNPFNLDTRFQISLPEPGQVFFAIYNLRGEQIRVVSDNQPFPAGIHALSWNGRDSQGNVLPSGLYVYQIKIADWSDSGKLVLLK